MKMRPGDAVVDAEYFRTIEVPGASETDKGVALLKTRSNHLMRVVAASEDGDQVLLESWFPGPLGRGPGGEVAKAWFTVTSLRLVFPKDEIVALQVMGYA
jgi:hypothetical protein